MPSFYVFSTIDGLQFSSDLEDNEHSYRSTTIITYGITPITALGYYSSSFES